MQQHNEYIYRPGSYRTLFTKVVEVLLPSQWRRSRLGILVLITVARCPVTIPGMLSKLRKGKHERLAVLSMATVSFQRPTADHSSLMSYRHSWNAPKK